jgi:drug/metabolite transporter (DMT)-like permease
MNIARAVFLKLISTFLFAVMSALIRWVAAKVPLGEIVFFRAAFAIAPVVVIYAWRRELLAAVRTRRPFGHAGRGLVGAAGMFFNFAALARLGLADVTAIQFSSPLMTVALAAVLLRERVRIYRWSAVGIGLVGVLFMLVPQLDVGTTAALGAAATIGALCALASAFCNAASVIQTRRLTETETTPSIVFYFSLICSIAGLATFPFGWYWPAPLELAALVTIGVLGGISHLLLTDSYRYAPASFVAPFDYTAMLWAFLLGYFVFSEVPELIVIFGAAIVVGAGLFVIWRERQLGLERQRAREAAPPIA